MSPSQSSPQCGDNLCPRENGRELDHAAQVFFTEASPIASLQLSPDCGDNLSAILCPPPRSTSVRTRSPSCQYREVSAALAVTATCWRALSIIRPSSPTSAATVPSCGDAVEADACLNADEPLLATAAARTRRALGATFLERFFCAVLVIGLLVSSARSAQGDRLSASAPPDPVW